METPNHVITEHYMSHSELDLDPGRVTTGDLRVAADAYAQCMRRLALSDGVHGHTIVCDWRLVGIDDNGTWDAQVAYANREHFDFAYLDDDAEGRD